MSNEIIAVAESDYGLGDPDSNNDELVLIGSTIAADYDVRLETSDEDGADLAPPLRGSPSLTFTNAFNILNYKDEPLVLGDFMFYGRPSYDYGTGLYVLRPP